MKADQPVRSRSVTHRVARRRRIVVDGVTTAEPTPIATVEAATVEADAVEADAVEAVEADADASTETEAVCAKLAASADKRKRRPRSDPGDRRPTRAQRERRWRTTTAVFVLLLIASTVAGTMVGLRWNERRETADGLRAALAAGRQSAVNFMSLSVPTVDRDMQRIIEGATGDFKQEYARNKPMFRTQVVENRAESTCTVLRAAILSGDRDSAVVLVAVDATIKNVNTPDGRLSHYRIQLDLVKDGGSGRWLVSRLQFVG